MKLRFTLLIIISILLLIFIAIYVFDQIFNRSEGISPSLTTDFRLKMVRRAIFAYKVEEGIWPDLKLWKEQLLKFSDEFSMGIEPSTGFLDAWNKPIMYKITIDNSGKETVIVYSMGENSIDDKGNHDDLVAKIENGKLVD